MTDVDMGYTKIRAKIIDGVAQRGDCAAFHDRLNVEVTNNVITKLIGEG